MEQESAVVKRARELNVDIQQLFDEKGRKPMEKSNDVVGIIILRYTKIGDVAVTCIGQVNFFTGMAALEETDEIATDATSQELNPVA